MVLITSLFVMLGGSEWWASVIGILFLCCWNYWIEILPYPFAVGGLWVDICVHLYKGNQWSFFSIEPLSLQALDTFEVDDLSDFCSTLEFILITPTNHPLLHQEGRLWKAAHFCCAIGGVQSQYTHRFGYLQVKISLSYLLTINGHLPLNS